MITVIFLQLVNDQFGQLDEGNCVAVVHKPKTGNYVIE